MLKSETFFFLLKLSPPYFRYSPSRGRKETLLAHTALFRWKAPIWLSQVREPFFKRPFLCFRTHDLVYCDISTFFSEGKGSKASYLRVG